MQGLKQHGEPKCCDGLKTEIAILHISRSTTTLLCISGRNAEYLIFMHFMHFMHFMQGSIFMHVRPTHPRARVFQLVWKY